MGFGDPGSDKWNYLRVRGEYTTGITPVIVCSELPPRARRIHTRNEILLGGSGTTSACAENTVNFHLHFKNVWNYLRVRGEYTELQRAIYRVRELPPRARRIQ